VSPHEGDDAPASSDTVDAPVSRAAEGAHRPHWLRRLITTLLPVVLIVVVCGAVVGAHVSEYRQLGPLDEHAHLDIVNRILAGGYPVIGDKLMTKTRHEYACRGIETPAGFGDHGDCKTRRTRSYPERAFSYEATQPPLYYGVTAELSRVTPGDGVDSIRRVGAVWLAIGAVALYLTLRRFAVGAPLATVLSLAVALSPPLVLVASVVTNDVAVWSWAACTLLVVVTLVKGPQVRIPHLLAVAAIGVVGGLVKPTAPLIALAIALAALHALWWAGRPKWGLLLGGSLVGGALLATVGWGLVVDHVQHVPLQHIDPWNRFTISSLDLDQLFKQPLFRFVTTVGAFIPSVWRADWRLQVLIQVAMYVQIALLLLPLVGRTADRVGRSVGIAYLAAVAVSGPYYVLLYAYATHILYGADSRYAFGLLPLMAVVLVAWVPKLWQRWTLAALLALPGIWYVVLVTDIASVTKR
jgi:hypothetical protein